MSPLILSLIFATAARAERKVPVGGVSLLVKTQSVVEAKLEVVAATAEEEEDEDAGVVRELPAREVQAATAEQGVEQVAAPLGGAAGAGPRGLRSASVHGLGFFSNDRVAAAHPPSLIPAQEALATTGLISQQNSAAESKQPAPFPLHTVPLAKERLKLLPSDGEYKSRPLPDRTLLCSLRLGEVSMEQLHAVAQGSVVNFLLGLRSELAKTKGLEHLQINILGIHGRYLRLPPQESSSGSSSLLERPRMGNEVLVEFTVAPVDARPETKRPMLEAINARLKATDNALLNSPFGFVLRNASVAEVSQNPALVSPPTAKKHEPTGSMLLPLGVSAAITGTLAWVAVM